MYSTSTTFNASPPSPLWRKQAVLTACIFAACLVGIFSRPIGYLAAFWPANAIMLGILIRHPELGRLPTTWLAGLLSYIVADLITGSSLFIALTLNLANVAGVLCAWAILRTQEREALSFQRQRSVLLMFSACLLGAIGCTAVGAFPGSIAFDVPLGRSIALWLSSEFFNYILIVPLFMAAPKGWFWTWSPTPIFQPWSHGAAFRGLAAQ